MADYQEEDGNGLMIFNGLQDLVEDDVRDDSAASIEQEKEQQIVYNSRKPKWWTSLCGKPTKAQKRSMNEVLKTHELPRIPHAGFVDWKEMFPTASPDLDIWLEIGFGRGENLLALADCKQNENVALVGAEMHRPGVGVVCQRVEKAIQSHRYWTEYIPYSPKVDPYSDSDSDSDGASEAVFATEPVTGDGCDSSQLQFSDQGAASATCSEPYKNLRIYAGDGVKLLPKIPSSSLAAVLVTFPDPFAKQEEQQWRVIQTHTILEIHRILKKSRSPGLLFLATDHEGFHNWSHEVMNKVLKENQAPLFERIDPCPDRMQWLPAISRYEQKGWDEGRRTRLSCWKAISSVVTEPSAAVEE